MPSIRLPANTPSGNEVTLNDIRTMVIVGANGSGKSQIGVQIERAAEGTNPHVSKVHRITAQRALKVPPSIAPRSYEQAQSMLWNGAYEATWTEQQRTGNKFSHRWGDEAHSRLLNDFEHVLAMLFADEAKRNREYTRAALETPPTEAAPQCKLNVFEDIWSLVMPHRTLMIYDDKIETLTADGDPLEARHMSDGERVAIYLIGQCLCAPVDSVIIIDEPEIHLHKAVQPLLWDQLEAARLDCAFVYITHDLDFASTRHGSRIIWLKGFNGSNWDWEEIIPIDGFPDALVLEVLGNRRPTLFVEGGDSSIDLSIYSLLFPDRHIIPCASCNKVIESTRSLRSHQGLHHRDVHGLVDQDRRSHDEIAALKNANVSVAEVAEVENLFCINEVLLAVAKQLGSDDCDKSRQQAQERVFTELALQIEQQSLMRAIAEIQFKLNGFGPKVGNKDANAIAAELSAYLGQINFNSAVTDNRNMFTAFISSKDYDKTLQFFNSKGIISVVAASFGVQRERYIRLVMSIVKGDPQGLAASAMRAKLPLGSS